MDGLLERAGAQEPICHFLMPLVNQHAKVNTILGLHSTAEATETLGSELSQVEAQLGLRVSRSSACTGSKCSL